jgi:hypothetical protein
VTHEIFISYRRDDSSSEAGRLADAIRNRFGGDSVFVDTSDTRLGQAWPAVLRAAVEDAAVVVAVIGPDWILARDQYGRRRIDDPDDWVRREIRLALERGKTIVPLLVRLPRMMPADALPSDIAELPSRQAYAIRGESWTHDVELVLRELERHVAVQEARAEATAVGPPDPPPPITPDDFRAVALGLDSADVRVRTATDEEIEHIAASLTLDDVLGFARSRKMAERAGAAVAIGVHIRSSLEARDDLRVRSALAKLLNDPESSLIRYRAAKALRSSPALVPIYEDELASLAKDDDSAHVQDMAAKALRRARR